MMLRYQQAGTIHKRY